MFHNGAVKAMVRFLCDCIGNERMLVKTSTTTNSVNDWCGYETSNPDVVKKKEDYILLLSGMTLATLLLT